MSEESVADVGADAYCEAVPGSPAKVLVAHSADADLPVMGSRDLAASGLLLGSVS
jgi:nucleotide-binding universal stress UspA family protein